MIMMIIIMAIMWSLCAGSLVGFGNCSNPQLDRHCHLEQGQHSKIKTIMIIKIIMIIIRPAPRLWNGWSSLWPPAGGQCRRQVPTAYRLASPPVYHWRTVFTEDQRYHRLPRHSDLWCLTCEVMPMNALTFCCWLSRSCPKVAGISSM